MSLERLPIEPNPWTGEHLYRYYEVCKLLDSGSTVLDIACGSGYGTNIIQESTGNIAYGGDIDQGTIAACKNEWGGNKKLVFELMDGTQLRFTDDFFDAVISLETIEHLTQYKEMINELARVCKKSGKVIISTPNIKVLSPEGVKNPYHTQEFTYAELKDILESRFSSVKIYGQLYTRYEHGGKKMQNFFERLFLTRGIRKLPYSLRNRIFSWCFSTELYPTIHDYSLFSERNFIENNCHVLFAVCER